VSREIPAAGQSIYIGIDIGNTKTGYITATGSGDVLTYFTGPGTNYHDVGTEETIKRVSAGYTRALVAGAGFELRGVFVGAAGADTITDYRVLETVFGSVFGAIPYHFDNDGLVALKNGTEMLPGIVVTCGTGNTNYAVDETGTVLRIGGLSEELGDRMGASSIARATTSAAVRSLDGRDYPTIVPELLVSESDIDSPQDLITRFGDADVVPRVIKVLSEAASRGDGRALSIFWDFTTEILKIVDRFAVRLFPDRKPFRLVLDGPVYSAGYKTFLTMISLAVHARYSAEIVIPETPPVVGALYLAYERDNLVLDETRIARVKETFRAQKSAKPRKSEEGSR